MKKILLPLLLFALIAISSCMQCTGKIRMNDFESFSAVEFGKFIADTAVQLVDVRTPEEYNAGHIPGSINIDVGKGHEELARMLDPECPVALYCRSGNRSKNAAKVLKAVFFKKVVELDGGYNEWVEYVNGYK